MIRLAAIMLALSVLAAGAHAQGDVREPEDYRTESYRAPVPATLAGARVLTTLLYNLRRTGGHRGIATLCLGGGNAVSALVERE